MSSGVAAISASLFLRTIRYLKQPESYVSSRSYSTFIQAAQVVEDAGFTQARRGVMLATLSC